VIEGEFGVGKEAVLFGEGKMDVNGRKGGYEAVFERANVPLGNIHTAIVRGITLDVRTRDDRVKALSEVGGGFVISGEVGDRVTTSSKEGEDGFVGGDVSGGGAGRHGDNVSITLVCSNECVLVTAGRFDGESPREIGEVPVRTGNGACVGGIGGGVKATRFNGGRERGSAAGCQGHPLFPVQGGAARQDRGGKQEDQVCGRSGGWSGQRGRTKRAVMVSNEGGVGEVVNMGTMLRAV
jgi:hypothetical protein